MRPFLAILATAGAGVVGALVLGEYAIAGLVGLAAGVVFGLLVGEVAIGVGGGGSGALAVASALAAGGGVLGAGWISTSHDLGRLEPEAWGAVALAAVAGALRARPPRRGDRTSPVSEPGP